MSLLNKQEQQRISETIESIEKLTDAELVTVLAARSDNYHYIPTLWSALLALMTPSIIQLGQFWLELQELFLIQIIVFVSIALLFRIPALMVRLIPKKVRFWRAANMARRQFLEQGLHRTKGATGVLIFVSEAEHYVEILADQGIDQYISQADWQQITDSFVGSIKKGQVQDGFIDAINSCGKILAKHVPATEQKNELPNHLILI